MGIFTPLSRQEIQGNEQYLEVKENSAAFRPKEHYPYGWVYGHAIRQLDMAEKAVQTLDAKAEAMVRFLGPGSSILSLGFALLAALWDTGEFGMLILVFLGVLLFILSTITALRISLPYDYPIGGSVLSAAEVSDHFADEEQSLGYFAANLQESITALGIISKHKAWRLSWCHRFFLLGLLSFVFAGAWLLIARFWQ